jgi:hypothetical protein
MIKQISVQGQNLQYNLKTSRKAKNLRLAVNCDGEVTMTKPYFVSDNRAEQFFLQKINWILSKIKKFRDSPPLIRTDNTLKHFRLHKASALRLIRSKLEHFSDFYQVKYNKITIRRQRTRWGSCSARKNLSFNYRIALLPEAVADYIIVHELCHLREFNHSRSFWRLVAQTIPDYRKIRRELKNN